MMRADFGVSDYGGPCPPDGKHPQRNQFTVFAVGADKLPVATDTSAARLTVRTNIAAGMI